MRYILILTFLLSGLNALAASECQVDDFLKSQEGQDKLLSLTERSKSLIISKLEDFGINESQLELKTVLPKSLDNSKSTFEVSLKSKNLEVQKASFKIKKVLHEEDCGIEVIINGGTLIDTEKAKSFGKLGLLKEFIKIN